MTDDQLRDALQYATNWLADLARYHGQPQAEVALTTIKTRTGVVPHESYGVPTTPTNFTLYELLTDHAPWFHLSANDTFAYATADATRIYCTPWNLLKLIDLYERFHWAGVVAFQSVVREQTGRGPFEPLERYVTDSYRVARALLDGWEYQDD